MCSSLPVGRVIESGRLNGSHGGHGISVLITSVCYSLGLGLDVFCATPTVREVLHDCAAMSESSADGDKGHTLRPRPYPCSQHPNGAKP